MRALVWTAVSSEKQAGLGTISLEVQEEMCKAACLAHRWTAVEILRMAHSRYFTDLNKWAASLAKKGNPAGNRFLELWEKRGFDVLVVHTMDRLGSTSSMITRVIEETVRMGATIYIVNEDTVINLQNYAMVIAFASIFTTTRMLKVRQMREIHIDNRVPKGGPGLRHGGWSHVVKRGLTRGEDRLVVNEELHHVWLDAARLFVDQQIASDYIEEELYKQFGHVSPKTGKPFLRGTYYQMLHRATFWGHSVRHFGTVVGHKRHLSNYWAYDLSEPVPEGVVMYRNTHEPVYTGELALSVIAELKRRHNIRGRAKPKTELWASGLLFCAECGYRLGPSRSTRARKYYWQCRNAYSNHDRPSGYLTVCDYKGSIRDDRVREQVADLLIQWCKDPNPASIAINKRDKAQADPDVIREELKDIDAKMNRLVDLQLSVAAGDSLQQQYAERLQGLSEQKRIKIRALTMAEAEEEANSPREFLSTITRIADMGPDAFWAQDPAVINQELIKLIGKSRFLIDVKTGKLIGAGKVKVGRSKY